MFTSAVVVVKLQPSPLKDSTLAGTVSLRTNQMTILTSSL